MNDNDDFVTSMRQKLGVVRKFHERKKHCAPLEFLLHPSLHTHIKHSLKLFSIQKAILIFIFRLLLGIRVFLKLEDQRTHRIT